MEGKKGRKEGWKEEETFPRCLLGPPEQCILGSVGMDRVQGEQLELTVLFLSRSDHMHALLANVLTQLKIIIY